MQIPVIMKNIFVILFALSVQFSLAQNKLLSLEDAVLKQRTTLAPAKLKQLMWIKNTHKYSYTEVIDNIETLVIGDATSTERKTTINLKLLNDGLAVLNMEGLQAFPTITWKDANAFLFEHNQKQMLCNLANKGLMINANRQLESGAKHEDISAVSNYVAYTVDNNLLVNDGKNNLIVTNDADENIVNGQSVHRDEFGISKGTFWSPDGFSLAYYRMDQTMVTDYPIINWTTRPAKNENIKYPMAGDKSHEVTVGIYNTISGKTVFIKTGEPREQYLTNLCWSPDGQHIYIAVLNREQNKMQLNSYNTLTGNFEKTLFEETNAKYVHPIHPMIFVPNKPTQFIWQSERDGFNHLYLYDINGKLIKQVTKGNYIVTEFSGFDKKGENVYFTSTMGSWLCRHLCIGNLKSGNTKKLTPEFGTHTTFLSDSREYFIDNFQSTQIPREISIKNIKGKKIQVLKFADNPLRDYQLGEMNLFALQSSKGDSLFCRMYKPIQFDKTKKYPCIVYVYNGPGVQLISNTWNGQGDLWFQYMAQQGFVVFTMDGRGSTNRGIDFEQATFRNLGTVEMEDQLVGINYLKSSGFVDSTRMGLFGWSYGGFMTTSMMTRYPGIFKAAVAGGPVIDWSYYEIMYTERYMDTPQENPEGYKQNSLLNHVKNLKGKLLVIHGTQDPLVVWQHSLLLLKAAVENGKQVDYYVYPGHEHNVLGKDRAHLYQKITDYFMDNLK
jgi:dipeptidyl-peptidase 4